MKIEWWYDDSFFRYPEDVEIALARLTVRDDGSAEILDDGQQSFEFENEDQASMWLGDEEYRRVESLVEDLDDEHRPVDARLRALLGDAAKEYAGPMLFNLELGSPDAPNPVIQTQQPAVPTITQNDN
jgi:hypothetical protein